MNRTLSRRATLAIVILIAILLLVVNYLTRPQLAPGQAPLTDISTIETLRMQFNQDAGMTRLILLASPT